KLPDRTRRRDSSARAGQAGGADAEWLLRAGRWFCGIRTIRVRGILGRSVQIRAPFLLFWVPTASFRTCLRRAGEVCEVCIPMVSSEEGFLAALGMTIAFFRNALFGEATGSWRREECCHRNFRRWFAPCRRGWSGFQDSGRLFAREKTPGWGHTRGSDPSFPNEDPGRNRGRP